jgi:hypothetical protein
MADENKTYLIELSQKDLVRILRSTGIAKDWALEMEKEAVYNKAHWAEDAKEYAQLHDAILAAVRDGVSKSSLISALRTLKERCSFGLRKER